MNFPTLLFLAASLTTLVLRSGDRIAVEGSPVRQNGLIVFRSGGGLFSISELEVDEVATAKANAEASSAGGARKALKVSVEEQKRLLRQLEENHSGQPAAPQKLLENPPEPPSAAERAAASQEEWRWRNDARRYQEAIRQAEENLALLRERAERLRDEIRTLYSLGYKPGSFSYQTTQLANTQDQIPYAQLDVERARRAWDQFRDDARRQGILPGWLR